MRRYFWRILLAAILFALFFGGALVRLYTDWIWFTNLGFDSIFGRILATKAALFLLTTIVFFAIIYFNLRLARKIAPIPTERLIYADELRQRIGIYAQRGLGMVLVLGALVVAVIVGLGAISHWDEILRFIYAVPFGKPTDPIFHNDLGFYVFKLPVLRYIYSQAFLALALSLIGVTALYYLGQAIEFLANIPRFAPRVKTHIFTLIALLFLLRAWGYWLSRYGLLFKDSSLIPGPGYTDMHARLPALYILMAISIIGAILTWVNIPRRGIWLVTAGFVSLIGASILVGSIYPGTVQKFVVQPNELAKESRYISYGIKMTRSGYGLTDVERRTHVVTNTLTQQDVAANQATTQNVRLWDYSPLLRVYKQMQELQQYYEFSDVDIDRYTINGQYRQVMLSARELQQEGLPQQARTWVNNHLVYTHGYGLVMSPVNEVTDRGFPRYFIENVPVASNVDLEVKTPSVYFGELTDNYALVKTSVREFDYPEGQKNVYTRYSPDRGIRVGNYFTKLLFALRTGDVNMLITPNITSQSRLLFRRTVRSRMTALFPFLRFDNDPYLVLSDGRMCWVQDAYTTSNGMPYSQQIRMQFNYTDWPSSINYIRNSVKITMDAKTGDVLAYISDKRDPIIQVYERAFKGVFKSMSQMPADLRLHIRYPEDLFDAQTTIYNTYHMTDPRVFYNKGDLWETPEAQTSGSNLEEGENGLMEPYYVIMRLPGEKDEEFILLRPATRANRNNMVAWICAKCDKEDYGRLVLFEFQKGQLVYGPKQIEGKANQNPEISRQLTLWGQIGSKVTWGNLLVIPIEQSIMYVQPLYLEATAAGTSIPEFLRVIVAVGDQIAMEEDLNTAMAAVTGAPAPGRPSAPRPQVQAPPVRPSARPSPAAPPAVTEDTVSLEQKAAGQFRRAQEAQRRGDWAAYGEELKRLEQTLNELERRGKAKQ
ncbi:MAG: UPF0182 family protein [Armatimonadota bacterium]|nr:UPF0182 family protein [Armatimonadota bacterium]